MAALDAPMRTEFERRIAGKLTPALAAAVHKLKESAAEKPVEIATRKASEASLEALVEALPEMIGGSADLTGSNNTKTKRMKIIAPGDFSGRFIHWGVREHGMAAAMNGMALHGGVIPFSGTFLVFADYCRPSIRLAALMGQRVIHVMTHDSIGLGEDGPTHQPVEHAASWRDPEPARLPAGGSDRNCRMLAARYRARQGAEHTGADAAESSRGAQALRRGESQRARRL
jgi:transketolase